MSLGTRLLLVVGLLVSMSLGIWSARVEESTREERGVSVPSEGLLASQRELLKKLARLRQILEGFENSLSALKGYVFVGRKKVYKNGRYTPEEEIKVEVDRLERRIHMKWLSPNKRGQEVWWPAGENDPRLVARGPGWKRIFKVKLDPLSDLAMKDSLHPIYHVGFDYIAQVLQQQLKLAQEYGVDLEVEDCSDESGRICLEITLPKDRYPEFYCYRARIEFNPSLKLPTKLMIWDKIDGEMRLVESYEYTLEDLEYIDGTKDADRGGR